MERINRPLARKAYGSERKEKVSRKGAKTQRATSLFGSGFARLGTLAHFPATNGINRHFSGLPGLGRLES